MFPFPVSLIELCFALNTKVCFLITILLQWNKLRQSNALQAGPNEFFQLIWALFYSVLLALVC